MEEYMKTSKFILRFVALFIAMALVFSLFGASLAETLVVDTALSQYSFALRGEYQHSTLGEVSILGDFNNDGIDDLLVGAPASSFNGKQFAGAAYVVYGGTDRAGLNLNSTPANISIYGLDSGDVLGHSVAAGDINGDGIDDIIVGADLVDRNGTDVGAVYIFLGREEPITSAARTLQPSNANVIIYGEFNGGRFGRAVASGDVTGSGINDILVGAYYASPGGRIEAGALYVIQGSSSFNRENQTVIDLMADPNTANLRIYGAGGGAPPSVSTLAKADRIIHPALEDVVDDLERALQRGDRLGRSIAVGNVNGDGPPDIIVGAYLAAVNGQSEAGKTYVFSGSSQYQTPGNIIDLGNGGQANVTINGSSAGEQSGFYVSTGRINDDPYYEVVIGAYLANDQAGKVYVVNGGAAMPSQVNLSNQANIVIHGAAAGDRLGRSLALADITGNGQDDLLIGASRAAPRGRIGAGTAYVIYTNQELPSVIQLNQTDLNHVRILGAQSGFDEGPNACVSDVEKGILTGNCPDELGRAIAAGDFLGNGRNEIVVGALFSNNGNLFNAGAVYVFDTETLGQFTGMDFYLPLMFREAQ
jgi:hypothetical protein